MAKNEEAKVDVNEELTATEGFFDQNKKFLIIGGVSIVVIVLGIFGYKKLVSDPKVAESHDAYWNAFYEYQNNDTSTLAYTGNEYFEGFESLAADYDGTPGGEIANYAMATHAMDSSDWDGALEYLDACDFEDIMIANLVKGMKGDCYVEKGEYETAVDLFVEAAHREENEFTSPMFLKKAGIVYEALNDYDSAEKMYREIKEKWEGTEEAGDIDKYIARVE